MKLKTLDVSTSKDSACAELMNRGTQVTGVDAPTQILWSIMASADYHLTLPSVRLTVNFGCYFPI